MCCNLSQSPNRWWLKFHVVLATRHSGVTWRHIYHISSTSGPHSIINWMNSRGNYVITTVSRISIGQLGVFPFFLLIFFFWGGGLGGWVGETSSCQTDIYSLIHIWTFGPLLSPSTHLLHQSLISWHRCLTAIPILCTFKVMFLAMMCFLSMITRNVESL